MPSTASANIANPWIWYEHLHPKERSYWNKTRSKHRSPTATQAGTTLLSFHQKQFRGPSSKERTSRHGQMKQLHLAICLVLILSGSTQADFPPAVGDLTLT